MGSGPNAVRFVDRYEVKPSAIESDLIELDASIVRYVQPLDGEMVTALLRQLNGACTTKRAFRDIVYGLAPRIGAVPGGPVMVVLLRWPDSNTMFPVWNEIRERLQRALRSLNRIGSPVGRSVNLGRVPGPDI